MPGDSGVLVVTRVLSTTTTCTRGRGCNGHPAFPTPLGAKDSCTTRAHRAARSGSHVWNWSRHRHSGAMPTGPREARPDDRLRIEPGISRFRVWSCGPDPE